MKTESRIAFADRCGVSRSAITQAVDKGLVDFDAGTESVIIDGPKTKKYAAAKIAAKKNKPPQHSETALSAKTPSPPSKKSAKKKVTPGGGPKTPKSRDKLPPEPRAAKGRPGGPPEPQPEPTDTLDQMEMYDEDGTLIPIFKNITDDNINEVNKSDVDTLIDSKLH